VDLQINLRNEHADFMVQKMV